MTEMSPVEAIFFAALEKPSAAERTAFLDAACDGDGNLRQKVEKLLAAHPQVGSCLEPPLHPTHFAVPHPSDGPTSRSAVETGDELLAGRYRLLEEIGAGGMGTVWMARQTEPIKRLVAVKLIKPGMDSKAVLTRFEAERQALALMDHPHIAKVHDGGAAPDGRPFFVMELVKGVPITGFCDEHRLSLRQRLELFVPVCQAIQHAHQKGIIHRDVKPSNVLVALYDDKPVVKVIDFGVAKATGPQLTEETLHTGFGAVVGTVEYMSPEQASFNALDVDTRSDIYSLGVLLYELLTGGPPFSRHEVEKAGMLEVLRVIREQEPPKPSTRLSTAKGLPALAANRGTEPKRLKALVRGELDWIVMKALEKDRQRRYQTASALAADVQRYLNDEPVRACPPSPWYQVRKFARRHKAGLAMTGLVLSFSVLLGGLVGWAFRDRTARQEEITQQAVESLARARKGIEEDNLVLARQGLAEAKGRIGSDRVAHGGLIQQIEALEVALDRFDAFLESIDRAHQTQFPRPLALAHDINVRTPTSPEPPRRLVRDPSKVIPLLLQALASYQVLDQDDWLARLRGRLLGDGQVTRVRAAAYEELLWLADDVVVRRRDHRTGQTLAASEAARQGLAYLHKAEQAHVPTAAFYRMRARCRTELGEDEAARADEELARQTPDAIALDHFLLGVAAFDARDKAEMVKQFEAALRLEPTHYESLLRLGHGQMLLGRTRPEYEAAASAFTGCIMKRPDHAHAYVLRGYAYVRLGRYSEALADSSRAVDLDPNDAAAWNLRGWAHQCLNQLNEALADHSRAIELDPNDALFWADRSVTYQELGLPKQVVEDCSRVIELDPTFVAGWSIRGAAYVRLGQLEKAVRDLTKAIDLDPTYAVPHHDLGTAYFNQGKLDEAITSYQKAIELYPKYTLAYIDLGCALFDQGKLDDAIACYRKAIELDPNHSWAHNNLGNALEAQGKLDDAIACYRKAIELDPKYAKAHNNLGLAFFEQGKLDDAIACYRKAIELDPNHSWTHYSLGNALKAQGKLDDAIACYRKAIELDSNHSWAHNNLGNALKAQGKLDDAIACYRKAIELDPKNRQAYFNLGNALYDQGKRDEAIACYRKAIELDPNYASAHHNLGSILYEQRKPDAAGACFQKALEYLEQALASCEKAYQSRPDARSANALAGSANALALLLATCPDSKFRDAARAVEHAKKAIDLAPKQGAFWSTLGVAHYRARDWKAALGALEKAMALRKGGDSSNWFFLAMVHWQLGNKDEARKWYDQAVAWMAKNQPRNGELLRFRAEAEELLNQEPGGRN